MHRDLIGWNTGCYFKNLQLAANKGHEDKSSCSKSGEKSVTVSFSGESLIKVFDLSSGSISNQAELLSSHPMIRLLITLNYILSGVMTHYGC